MKKVRVNYRNGEPGFTVEFKDNMMTCLETGVSVDKTEDEFNAFIRYLTEMKVADVEVLDEYETMVVFQTTIQRYSHGSDVAMPMDPEKDIIIHDNRGEAFDKHYELFRKAKSEGGSSGEHESVNPNKTVHKVRHIDGTRTDITTIAKVIKITKEQ